MDYNLQIILGLTLAVLAVTGIGWYAVKWIAAKHAKQPSLRDDLHPGEDQVDRDIDQLVDEIDKEPDPVKKRERTRNLVKKARDYPRKRR